MRRDSTLQKAFFTMNICAHTKFNHDLSVHNCLYIRGLVEDEESESNHTLSVLQCSG